MSKPGNKVVFVVFDGLRPDFIDAEGMPKLEAFARRSTWFREARSVFPSMTRVATTSIATGAMPGKHGLMNNAFYFPAVNKDRILDLGSLSDISNANRVTEGRLIEAPSFGDCVAMAGKTMAVVSTGAAGTTYCLNPRASRNGQWTFTLGRANSPTPKAVDEITNRFGQPPSKTIPRVPEMEYATTVMVDHVLGRISPDLAVIWFNEPDTSFHYKGLSSAKTNNLLRSLDDQFQRILDWVERQDDSERYSIIIASDHGHIATDDTVDLIGALSGAGFSTRHMTHGALDDCAVAFTGWNTGEVTFLSRDKLGLDSLVSFLRECEGVGCLFTRGRNEIEGIADGTFSFDLVGLDHVRRPDLVFTLRSSDSPHLANIPGRGRVEASCDVVPPGGMHGGLNRYELNSTLIAHGTHFSAGTDGRPSGIIDIAPTLLDLLGIAAQASMSGCSLLTKIDDCSISALKEFNVKSGGYSQTLSRIEVGSRIYLQEGKRCV